MGEAAEYEIFRQYGVDISDEGWLENSRKEYRKRSVMDEGSDDERSHLRSSKPAPIWPKRATSGHRYAIRCYGRQFVDGPWVDIIEFTDLYDMKCGILHIHPQNPSMNTLLTWPEDKTPPHYPGTMHKNGEAVAQFYWNYKEAAGAINDYRSLVRAKGLDPMLTDVEDRDYQQGTMKITATDYVYDTATQGTIQMNTNEMITIMQLEAGAKIVKALYLDDDRAGQTNQRSYCFKNVLGLNLKEGDLIVAETRDTFALLKVVDPDVMANDAGCGLAQLKHVVAKVRNEAFERVKVQENEAHRKLALSEVTSKLDTYRKQVGDGTFNSVASLLGAPEMETVVDEDDTE